MLLDANLLLYASDATSPHHARALSWLEDVLNGVRRVALPWQTIGAFLRIATHPRVHEHPLTSRQAWELVADWLACDVVWVPAVSERTIRILGELVESVAPTGNLLPDAQLAALAIENGLAICSADSDFARFPVTWVNPLTR